MKKSMTVAALLITALVFLGAGHTMAQKKWDIPGKYVSMKMATPSTAGKELYSQYCKSCHGIKGMGDGPKSASMKTKMAPLKTVKNEADGVVYFKSIVGRDEMPNFEKKIPNEADRAAVVKFVKSL